MSDRWVTNLESDALIQGELDQAKLAVADATATGNDTLVQIAKSALYLAEARHQGHQRTHTLLRGEYPGCYVDAPRATKHKSQAQLKAEGIVGIYRAKGA